MPGKKHARPVVDFLHRGNGGGRKSWICGAYRQERPRLGASGPPFFQLSRGGNGGRGYNGLRRKELRGQGSEMTRSVRWDCDFSHWTTPVVRPQVGRRK